MASKNCWRREDRILLTEGMQGLLAGLVCLEVVCTQSEQIASLRYCVVLCVQDIGAQGCSFGVLPP